MAENSYSTTLSKSAKRQIIKKLREEGYATYARLLDLFDVYMTDNPEHIAYMIPGKAVIVFNKNLTIDQVSTLARHEILHEYLAHKQRQERFHQANSKYTANHQLQNIAGDFEISNKGYTQRDKSVARAIRLGDQTLRGLVTEDQYPGWEHKTFEEMYEELLKQQQEEENALQKLIDMISKLNPENLDDLSKELDNASNGSESSDSEEQSSSSSKKSSDDASDEKAGNGSSADKSDKEIDDLKDELKDIEKEIGDSDHKPGKGNTEGEFTSGQHQRDLADVAARVAEIEKAFKDIKVKKQIDDENATAIRNERTARAAREAEIERVRGAGLNRFRGSLLRFIQNEVRVDREDTYTRFHPNYEDDDIIVPGFVDKEHIGVPSVNVYWDVSGSFSDPAKTAAARKAIETLNRYVRSGELKMKTYYHADKVSETVEGAGWGNNGNRVLKHIQQTKPDNVIIITDDGLFNTTLDTTVPGTVWMLFYDGRTEELIKHLHGKRETLIYDINYK